MGTYAGAKNWNKNSKQAAEALDKLKAKHDKEANIEDWKYVGSPGTKNKRMSEMDADEYALAKSLNDNEAEQEVQKQRIIDEYPKGTADSEGRKSRNTQGYGKTPAFKKGGKVKCMARGGGCEVRGKTKGRMV